MNTLFKQTINPLIFVTVTLLTVSCGGSSESAQNDATISGKINGNTSASVVYLESLGVANIEVVDSMLMDTTGVFSFDPDLGDKAFYRVRMGRNNAVLLALDSTEKVKLEINGSDFSDYTVTGSKDSEILRQLSAIIYSDFRVKDSMNTYYRQNYTNIDEATMEEFSNKLESLNDKFNSDLKLFITENSNSIAILAAIERLEVDKNYDTYKKVDESLKAEYADSPYYKGFHSKFEEAAKFAVGTEVPDIILPDPNGQSTSLSSLKGKVVLIDFWASWCKPCRIENPNVVRVYNQYKDKNFEIFSVSLDREKNAWLQAIKTDNMDWVHVSDLMFWQSPVVSLYNIKGIPHTLLIDEEGKIIAKDLRGKELEKKLAEIFG